MDNKSLNYLALAKKGRLAELGEEPVGACARLLKAHLIIVAKDASDHTWRRAKSYAAGTDQQCLRLDCTKEEMGFVVGRTSLAIAPADTYRGGAGNARISRWNYRSHALVGPQYCISSFGGPPKYSGYNLPNVLGG